MTSLDLVFPVITTTISFFFFMSVFEQYLRKRKIHQLMWSIGMFLFFVTAGAEALSYFIGEWEPTIYRLYYVLAAYQVTFMGIGVLYLLAGREVINGSNLHKPLIIFGSVWLFFGLIFLTRSMLFLVVIIPAAIIEGMGIYYWLKSRKKNENEEIKLGKGYLVGNIYFIMTTFLFIVMCVVAWSTELNPVELETGGQIAGLGWVAPEDNTRALVRLFSPLHTAPGGIALIGGALYSYFKWQRAIKKSTGKYSLSQGFFNIYIALGAYVLAVGGTLVGFGIEALYISESISVTLMYFGFLESDKLSMSKLMDVFTLKWLRKGKKSVSV
ncbi:MAG: hypothetical protein ACTSYA_09580 [Candidatus Kariarchaeaceae archaeon]